MDEKKKNKTRCPDYYDGILRRIEEIEDRLDAKDEDVTDEDDFFK